MAGLKATVLQFVPPFMLNQAIYGILAETPNPMDDTFISPTWTFAKKTNSGSTVPQTIAHRGFKAKYPENTMAAFKSAVEVGAHALETDIHLSKDGEVVLSHDGTLKRCFGEEKAIVGCDWSYISTLRTLKEPHEPMPRLRDLLEYLASPGQEDIWLLLDIKLDNDAELVMRLIAETISSVPPSSKPWSQRIILGIWAAKFLPLCTLHLSGLAVTYIGFSPAYASQFLTVPHVSFNMLQKVLYLFPSFIKQAQRRHRAIYLWTVNEESMMRWSISKAVDGVITDDPEGFNRVLKEWEGGRRGDMKLTWGQLAMTLWIGLMVVCFGWMFRWKFPRWQGVRGKSVGEVKA